MERRGPGKDPSSDEAHEHKPAALRVGRCRSAELRGRGAGRARCSWKATKGFERQRTRRANVSLPTLPPRPEIKYEVSLKEMNWGAQGRGVSQPGRVAGWQRWAGLE